MNRKVVLTHKMIALLLAGCAMLVVAITFGCLYLFGDTLNCAVKIIISAVVIFITMYVTAFYITKSFIIEKVRPVYKIIRSAQMPKYKELIGKDVNLIETAMKDAEEWAEKKGNEIELLKKQEEFRKEYVGNVAHELRTPIFALQGYISTLLDGGLYDEKINTKYIEKALKNAERLGSIVKDLETITQYEASVLQINWGRFKIYDLCAEVIEEMERLAKIQNTEILFKEGINRNLIVQADREKIRQVLNNLISNAIKYGKENGKIWIGLYDMEKYVLIEITDNGNGIAEEHLPRLFERFYRIDPSRSRHHGGAGLGLAIVKHIIEAHHQTIHVRSTLGKGTTFGFTLQKKKFL